MTAHVVTYEHADARLSRVRVSPSGESAETCFEDWVADEEATGEGGAAGAPNAFDPEGAVQVWRGEYGSRIVRFELEVAG